MSGAGVAEFSARATKPLDVVTETSAAPLTVEPAAPPAPPIWVDVKHPIHLYELAGSDFGKLDLTYQAKRRGLGSERQDILRYGGFDDGTPSLELSINRKAAPGDEGVGLFVVMARLAADAHLSVVRSGLATSIGTRFGPFETADIVVARGSEARSCLGFQLQPGPQPRSVDIAGFACGTEAKPVDRAALACVIDRIDLVSAGEDDRLRDFFVEAERRRAGECVPPRLLAAGSRTMWMRDPGASSALRLTRAAGQPAR